MKNKLLIAVAILLLISTFALIGCDYAVTEGTVYNENEFMKNLMNVYTHKFDNISKEWKPDGITNGSVETLKTADNYLSWVIEIKRTFISSKKNLVAVSFVVKTDTDCTINFSFYAGKPNNDFKSLVQKEVTFNANEEIQVTIEINRVIGEITTTDLGAFYFNTRKYTPNADENGTMTFDGQEYDSEYTTNEVNFTATNFQIIVKNVD
jgi:hypothetical protein